jgi:tyrosinase
MAIRKSVSSLSATERAAFVQALKLLKAAPCQFTPPTAGRYDDYVYTHMQAMLVIKITDTSKPVRNGNWSITSDMRMPMWAHRCPAFLPWHRELLHQFERDLQQVSGNAQLGLPYWNWSVDQSPTASPWTDDCLGGDGQDGPVSTGPFAGKDNWELTISEDGVDHLVRGFGFDRQAGPRLPTPTEETATLAQATYDTAPWSDDRSEATFRNQLEGWYVPSGSDLPVGMHNVVHVWVGGTQGSMLPSSSPNDPVFFLHHCNIDRLWAVWQHQHPSGPLYTPVQPIDGDPGQSLNEPMIFYDNTLSSTPPWADPPVTPSRMIDHRTLNYSYDTDPASFDIAHGLAATRQVTLSPAEAARQRQIDPIKQRRLRIDGRDRFRKRLREL